MKKKVISSGLFLKKKTIVNLNAEELLGKKGGATYPNCSAIDACPSALGCSVVFPCQFETNICPYETEKRCPSLIGC